MPNQPTVDTDSVSAISGNRYKALTGAGAYTVWSLKNHDYHVGENADTYLDAAAELLWEKLLRPARDQLDEKTRRLAGMTYVKDLPREGLPGRQYTLMVGDQIGTSRFFVAHDHIYILLAMGKCEDWAVDRFFSSFKSSFTLPTLVPNIGNPVPGVAAPHETDYDRIFTGREVTAKVRVLAKPEPTYTDSARKFGVQGTVVLRCVFSKDAEVTNLHVVSKLPHGLTQRAIDAAKRIRFTPAMKDGVAVSMWMELQYNFNLY